MPPIPGVWANGKTLEECREELESVLEGWVLLSIADHSPTPDINGNRMRNGKRSEPHGLTTLLN